MTLNAAVTLPRPRGHWEVEKIHVPTGKTTPCEAGSNLILDKVVRDFMLPQGFHSRVSGPLGTSFVVLYLSANTDTPNATATSMPPFLNAVISTAGPDIITEDVAGYPLYTVEYTAYFYPTGLPASDDGLIINSLFASTNTSTNEPLAWKKLNTPITLHTADCLKVTASFTRRLMGSNVNGVTSPSVAGAPITQRLYALGESPANPGDGTAGDNYTWEIDFFLCRGVVINIAAPDSNQNTTGDNWSTADDIITHPDGSLSRTYRARFTSPIRSILLEASDISGVSFKTTAYGTFRLKFTGATKPQWLPGHRYQIEVSITVTVPAA